MIGGSYFLGRWFVQHAYKEHDITVLNRGTIPVGLEGVNEIVADRHDDDMLCKLKSCGINFDAVVDFCAYNPGDISRILKHLKDDLPERYIYVSTVDVYRKGTGCVLDESAPLADTEGLTGDEGEYIKGKILLEHELVSECGSYGIHGVSVRPAILYGPGNYAPRESVYFDWISQMGQIIHPSGSDGFFQMLYVSDAAKALVKLCELSLNELKSAYNFCTNEILTYDTFENALEEAYGRYNPDASFSKIEMPIETVLERGIPLPFPLLRSESETCGADLFNGLGITHTPLETGLYNCMKIFML